MTVKDRQDLDALDLLMQGHREVESLFKDFDHLRQHRGDTGRVIENACAELGIHDALETEIFYAALREAADDEKINGLLDQAEAEHTRIRELVGELGRAQGDQRDACFARIAGRMQQHMLGEEATLFPQVRNLKRLDLESLTATMKKRNTALIADMEFPETTEETV
jgi:hypothetical protein